MPTKRHVLDLLQRDELLQVVDHFELDVRDRRVKSQLVDAIAAARRPSLTEILEVLSRDCLKDLCKSFDLKDGGREKAVFVERILLGRCGKSRSPRTLGRSTPSYSAKVSREDGCSTWSRSYA